MWRLYDAAGKGVAVRTTSARLKRSLVGGDGSNQLLEGLGSAVLNLLDAVAAQVWPHGRALTGRR